MPLNLNATSNSALFLVLFLVIYSCRPKLPTASDESLAKDTVLLVEDTRDQPITDTAGNTVPFRYESALAKAKGIGLLKTNFYLVNYTAGRSDAYYIDSIDLYDRTLNHRIGFVPIANNGHGISYDATVWLEGDTIVYRRCDGDTQGGIANWEGASFVYAKSDDWMNIFPCRYGLGTTWINLQELDSTAAYISWLDYFRKYPQGNIGWTHGYSWIGNPNAPILFEPNQDSIIARINGDVEIHPTGNFEGHWAEVVVKEVEYIFGEYFEKEIYGEEWKGWLKVVSANGHPLITEVILGC